MQFLFFHMPACMQSGLLCLVRFLKRNNFVIWYLVVMMKIFQQFNTQFHDLSLLFLLDFDNHRSIYINKLVVLVFCLDKDDKLRICLIQVEMKYFHHIEINTLLIFYISVQFMKLISCDNFIHQSYEKIFIVL